MQEKRKFVASFSSGKDSTLSVYKAIQAGMEPLGLVITYNTDAERAWFHGLPESVIQRLSEALAIPIELIRTSGAEYEANFEKKLREYRAAGADTCVFGDIDIEGHLQWGMDRCANSELTPFFPLWQMDRKAAVMEFLDCGFTTRITTVNTSLMSADYLGKALTRELMSEMEADGIDVCGENGEYHTLVTDGPLFKKPFQYAFGQPVFDHGYAKLPVF